MNKIQSLTYFDELPIIKSFRAKIFPNMTQDEKDNLNREFQEALALAKTEHRAKNNQVGKENTQFFLENPVSAIMQMYSGNCMWYIGEILNIYGIGNTTMKRFGKGTFVGKGTMGEGTISQFHMTATIGDRVLQEDTGCRNDRHSKNEAQMSTLGLLGSKIITDYIKGHPERSAEIEPIRYKLSHI